jgi:tetratricopeptide (TPR) repeat protein
LYEICYRPCAILDHANITRIAEPFFAIPFDRNPRFTARESTLAALEEKLFVGEQTTKTAIVGLGGIGKTQVALELAYRTRAKYKNCSVFWIAATDMDSLHQAYRDVAQQLRISGWDEEKADVKKLVQIHLSQADTQPWLLVFDNTDDMSMWICPSGSEPGSTGLKEYLPKSKQGCIVFTTRDRKTAVKLAGQNIVEVPEMDEVGAMHLLQKSLVNPVVQDDQDAKALVEELTRLPLAIVQAAAYINENSIPLTNYLSLLNDQEEEVIELLSSEFEDDWRYPSIKNPVATTWLISFEQIRHRDPLAADYLSFMACIDWNDIPISLLPAGLSRKVEMQAIGTLVAFSFVINREGATEIGLHRLVHLATRNWLQKEAALSRWAQVVIGRLEELFPANKHQNRTAWRRLLPHAAHALRLDMVAQDNSRRLDLAWKYANCLYSDGRYREAEVTFEEVYKTRIRVLGEEHLDTLASMTYLASTYRSQGRWKEAEKLEVQVLEIIKRVLGEEHQDTLSSMGNLASTYRNQGRWKEAETLEVQVMEMRKRVLGEEHPDTLTSMGNLASTYRNQGRWKEAETLEVQVMEMRKRVLGEEHPDTLSSMGNLASTYRNQGRWKVAEKLEVRVMETSLRELGEEHPDTLASMGNLASTYRNQGRWKEAETLEVQVIEMRKRMLGEEHPDTLSSMGNLASTYRNQGRWKEAEELEVQVKETSSRVLSEEHPDMLTSMGNLASTYGKQGRWKEAQELYLRVIEMRKKVLSKEHPDTLSSMANLASTYRNQERWEEAEKLEVQVMEVRTKVLGEEHLDTLSSMGNLASTYRSQGRWNEAEALDLRAMHYSNRMLKQEHDSGYGSKSYISSKYGRSMRHDTNPKVFGLYDEGTVYSASVISAAPTPRDIDFVNDIALALFESLSTPSDHAAWERILHLLPDLLRAFAVKFGQMASAQMEQDIAYFVHKHRL